jgi:organic radical activating enzyme
MTTHYCNQKFNWAQVSIFDGRVQSCCEAQEDTVALDDITAHPVGFFNYPQIIKDRQHMLEGKKISGCSSCWRDEDRGLESRRIKHGSIIMTNSDPVNCMPETLNIVLSNTCALTCVYCCKKFSHSWRADLIKNGDYTDIDDEDQRFLASPKDQVLYRLSQSDLENTSFYRELLSQATAIKSHVRELAITGGEPFLSKNLEEIITQLATDQMCVRIYTGLGVSSARLKNVIALLTAVKNLTVVVSAENTDAHYEFVRYGNSFGNFSHNLDLLYDHDIDVKFSCSLNNISTFNFLDFVDRYGDKNNLEIHMVNQPKFLAVNVLDQHSKDKFVDRLNSYQNWFDINSLQQHVLAPCDQQLKRNCATFLTEFARRRNLSLDVFPKSFVSWLTK